MCGENPCGSPCLASSRDLCCEASNVSGESGVDSCCEAKKVNALSPSVDSDSKLTDDACRAVSTRDCGSDAAASTMGKLDERQSKDDCCKSFSDQSSEINESCCQTSGKLVPCCTPSCISELADRLCISECASDETCDAHKNQVHELYSDMLEKFHCLCKILREQKKDTCCVRSASVLRKRRCNRRDAAKNKSKQTADVAVSSDTRAPNLNLDLENGRSKDHCVFLIQGMTCTGCESKLQRSLTGIHGVTNVKPSLLMSRVEFDVDCAIVSRDMVASKLAKETGFGIEVCDASSLNGAFPSIDVLLDHSESLSLPYPDGVIDIKVSAKEGTAQIVYDPSVVGVRKLLDSGFGRPMTLAPVKGTAYISNGRKQLYVIMLRTIISVALTIPVLVLSWANLPADHQTAYSSASLALATLIQIGIVGPFYSSALRSLVFNRVIEMDLLIVLSTSAAYIFSVVAFAFDVSGHPIDTGGSHSQFFETSTLLVTLVMIGRFLAVLARQKAMESISTQSLQPKTATVIDLDSDSSGPTEIDIRLLQHGDIVIVNPDSRIPTDGIIVSGETEIDESAITGETVPVCKKNTSFVKAGTMNLSGLFQLRVVSLVTENTVSKISAAVDEAKMTKPSLQDLADRVASYFVPVIIFISVVTFVSWIAFGIGKKHWSGSKAVSNAITYAITTLIVSCPCAIGLTVPMVIVIATGVSLKSGIIIKNTQILQQARSVTHVVLDKTGTLTQFHLKVTSVDYMEPSVSRSELHNLLLAITGSNDHPVSTAIASYLSGQGADAKAAQLKKVKVLPGKGLEAVDTNGRVVRCGKPEWLETKERSGLSKSDGSTVLGVQIDGAIQAMFYLSDTERADAAEFLRRMRLQNIEVSIVSGDTQESVGKLASKLGIHESHAIAGCSPLSKLEYVKRIQNDNSAVVLFCGDGTNDAPALAQANVGVHLAHSDSFKDSESSVNTGVASQAADAIVVTSSNLDSQEIKKATQTPLKSIDDLISLSRSVYHRILLNFAWSFIYNVVAILFSCGVFPKSVHIPAQYAGLGEIVSVLPVILVAIQLQFSNSSTSTYQS